MLILASSSPRRRELLTLAGFTFDVQAADIDETPLPNELPEAYVQRLAIEKAEAVLALHPEATVIGADTTVVFYGEIMAKPEDSADAERMLHLLSGQTHDVHTGIAVLTKHVQRAAVETTKVTFSHIPPDELAIYIASGNPMDKAGAYGIQSYAARWIPRIEGDYFNVVGLPIAATVRLLNSV